MSNSRSGIWDVVNNLLKLAGLAAAIFLFLVVMAQLQGGRVELSGILPESIAVRAERLAEDIGEAVEDLIVAETPGYAQDDEETGRGKTSILDLLGVTDAEEVEDVGKDGKVLAAKEPVEVAEGGKSEKVLALEAEADRLEEEATQMEAEAKRTLDRNPTDVKGYGATMRDADGLGAEATKLRAEASALETNATELEAVAANMPAQDDEAEAEAMVLVADDMEAEAKDKATEAEAQALVDEEVAIEEDSRAAEAEAYALSEQEFATAEAERKEKEDAERREKEKEDAERKEQEDAQRRIDEANARKAAAERAKQEQLQAEIEWRKEQVAREAQRVIDEQAVWEAQRRIADAQMRSQDAQDQINAWTESYVPGYQGTGTQPEPWAYSTYTGDTTPIPTHYPGRLEITSTDANMALGTVSWESQSVSGQSLNGETGWHNNTVTLGTVGNTVLSVPNGVIFGVSHTLQEGDKIIVYDTGGVPFYYAVSEVRLIPASNQTMDVRSGTARYTLPTADERLTILGTGGSEGRPVVVAYPSSGSGKSLSPTFGSSNWWEK